MKYAYHYDCLVLYSNIIFYRVRAKLHYDYLVGAIMILQKYGSIEIQSSGKESEAVKRAIIHLRRDLVRVFQAKAVIRQKERFMQFMISVKA